MLKRVTIITFLFILIIAGCSKPEETAEIWLAVGGP